jgi:hypothetical protein
MSLCGMQGLSLILHARVARPGRNTPSPWAVYAGNLTSHLRFGSVSRLLNRPQRERLPFLKARISAINKIQPAVVTGAQEWFVFSEYQGVE